MRRGGGPVTRTRGDVRVRRATRRVVRPERSVAVNGEQLAFRRLLRDGMRSHRSRWLEGVAMRGSSSEAQSGAGSFAAIIRLSRVIDLCQSVRSGVEGRRIRSKIGRLRRRSSGRKILGGDRSARRAIRRGLGMEGSGVELGKVILVSVRRRLLDPKARYGVPRRRRIHRIVNPIVTASRGLRVGWGWMGWAARSAEIPGG